MRLQLEPITLVAIVGASSTLLSAVFAGWAALKQRQTEDTKLGYEAMRSALENYRIDNVDLRQRVTAAEARVYTAEQRIMDLTGAVNKCEADKALLTVEVAQQNDKIAYLERRSAGA